MGTLGPSSPSRPPLGSCSELSAAWEPRAAGRAGPGDSLTDRGWHPAGTQNNPQKLRYQGWDMGWSVGREILESLAHTSRLPGLVGEMDKQALTTLVLGRME